MRNVPFDETTVELSLRTYGNSHLCAYVTCIVDDRGGQRQIADSVHLTGRPEDLVDEALQRVRANVLEHWLSKQEPF